MNTFLLYACDNSMKKFLEKKALPYVTFRYNSTYELEVCNDYSSICKTLNSENCRVDYFFFYMKDENEVDIYKKIKREYSDLPILLFSYIDLDYNLILRPGFFPEGLVVLDQNNDYKNQKITYIKQALINIKEYLDSYQPDEMENNKKSIPSMIDGTQIYYINADEIISVESKTSTGKNYQIIKTTRGDFRCNLTLSDIEKVFCTTLFRCRRNVLINKKMIAGYNSSTCEILLHDRNNIIPIKASRDKFKQVTNAYALFLHNMAVG